MLKDIPDHVVGLSAEGKVTARDYETVFIPFVENKLKEHKKIDLLYFLGERFTGFNLGAMWDDTKLGMKHYSAWNRVALVSDHEMINVFARLFGHLFRCEFRVFGNSDFEEARKWISKK